MSECGRDVVAFIERHQDRHPRTLLVGDIEALERDGECWTLFPRDEQPRKGAVIAVRESVTEKARLAARVLEVRAAGHWSTCDWRVRLEIHSLVEHGRWLGKTGGYTTSEASALRDLDLRHAEPQPVSEDWQDELAKIGRWRYEVLTLATNPARIFDRDLLRKKHKLEKLQKEAKRLHVDIGPELNEAIEAVQAKIVAARRAA